MLAGNRIRALPRSLIDCDRLELIRIAANELWELPSWLLTMPRLSWLAFADNPFCKALQKAAVSFTSIADVSWSTITLERLLGQGASGTVHRATIDDADASPYLVAVKMFNGDLTSDGSPKSEMSAAVHAGSAAVRVLELSEIRDDAFKKLISQHHKLTTIRRIFRDSAVQTVLRQAEALSGELGAVSEAFS